MDVSDFELIRRLPEIINDGSFDQIIRNLLEIEGVKSIDDIVKETEVIESGQTPVTSLNAVQPKQSASSQLVRGAEGKKRKLQEYNINSETLRSDNSVTSEGSDTETVIPFEHVAARNSTHVCKAVTDKTHFHSSDVIEEPEKQSKSSDSTSSKRLCQFHIEEKTKIKLQLETHLSKEYARFIDKFDIKQSATPSPKQSLQTTSISSVDGLKSCDLDERKDAPSEQPALPKLHGSLDGMGEDPIFDVSKMKEVVSTLVAAQAMCCSEIPKPGCKEWTLFRQDTRRRRDALNIAKADKQEMISNIGDRSVGILETTTKQCVEFAKQIPGYRSLHLSDQIALIKASRLETSVPSVLRSINADLNVVTVLSGQHFTFEELLVLYSDHFKDTIAFFKEHSRKSIWQTVTNEEEAVIKAIILTDADRCPHLQDRKKVVKMNRGMISCLMYVLGGVTDDVPKRRSELEYLLHTCSLFTAKYLNFFKEKLIKIPGQADNQALNEIL